MSKLEKITYSLKDVSVVQSPISYCLHRNEVNPFINVCERQSYPIFVAPMATVTDENNYKTWIDNKLTPVVPRSVQTRLSFKERMDIAKETFVSISLQEATNELMEYFRYYWHGEKLYICIDIAHGTLSSLYDICKKIKKLYNDNVIIMTGNIANPKAYSIYADCGIDYVRCGIGGGSRCTSACNVSIHYGMATLISELYDEKLKYEKIHGYAPTKIIADGGIGWFDDIQKCLALGADSVMCGNIIARSEEACSEIGYSKTIDDFAKGIYYTKEEVLKFNDSYLYKPYRDYYGMSTKIAQKITGGSGTKTSEGISKPVPVEYPIAKWIDNMQSYLRSCMTYTNSKTIKDLNNADVVILGGSGDFSYRK